MSDNPFPARLRKLREAKRINAKALGELCGLSKNMIGQYEKGEKRDHPENCVNPPQGVE